MQSSAKPILGSGRALSLLVSKAQPCRALSAGIGRGVQLRGRKRFWKQTGVEEVVGEDGWRKFAVTVDGRKVRTPRRNPLELPTKPLALAVALEWDAQDVDRGIEPETMPLMTLCATAIDSAEERLQMIDNLMRYLRTDTICFHAVDEFEDEELLKRQKKLWNPIHEWLKETYSVELNINSSLLSGDHEESAISRVREVVEGLDNFKLAALNCAVRECKSMAIGLALIHRKLTVHEAFAAARVEEEFNVENWGLVEGGHDMDRVHCRVQVSAASTLVHLLQDYRWHG